MEAVRPGQSRGREMVLAMKGLLHVVLDGVGCEDVAPMVRNLYFVLTATEKPD